jgi:hypothetical protein
MWIRIRNTALDKPCFGFMACNGNTKFNCKKVHVPNLMAQSLNEWWGWGVAENYLRQRALVFQSLRLRGSPVTYDS